MRMRVERSHRYCSNAAGLSGVHVESRLFIDKISTHERPLVRSRNFYQGSIRREAISVVVASFDAQLCQ